MLEATLLQLAATPARPIHEVNQEFRAIVLRVEQVLSFELEHWRLLMSRHEHDVSP